MYENKSELSWKMCSEKADEWLESLRKKENTERSKHSSFFEYKKSCLENPKTKEDLVSFKKELLDLFNKYDLCIWLEDSYVGPSIGLYIKENKEFYKKNMINACGSDDLDFLKMEDSHHD